MDREAGQEWDTTFGGNRMAGGGGGGLGSEVS